MSSTSSPTANHRPSALPPALKYSRIVVKASTNVLTRKSPRLDHKALRSLVAQIAAVKTLGARIALVSSGAIAAGREAAPAIANGRGVPFSQMLAAIGQSRLMRSYASLFSQHNITIAQALLTSHDVDSRLRYLNVRNTLNGLLEHGVLPIINENDVVDAAEITGQRFGDNDSLSAIVANAIEANLLIMLMDAGGLYTADPNRDPSASLIPRVDHIDDSILALAEERRDGPTRGGMLSKLHAAKRAVALGVTVVFAAGDNPNAILQAASGQPVGTLFPAAGSSLEARKRWLRSGLNRKGAALIIDNGARKAILEMERSLLPAGVREIKGHFERGDIIEIIDHNGAPLAYGVANYNAPEMRIIAGARSDRITDLLGRHHGDEAIHRNNLVLI